MELKGKIAVIAGASGGIGREISLALADEGVELILVARRKPVLNALKQIIEEKGGKAHVFQWVTTTIETFNIYQLDAQFWKNFPCRHFVSILLRFYSASRI